MYPKYFGLKEPSFSIAPDPEYLFLSEQHKEALAHLLYGAGESGGFVLLTGEVGTGKTTVCRAFLEQIPDGVDAALILNPAMTANELMLAICDEFRIEVPERERSVKSLVDRLNAYLLKAHARGRRPVLIIDEAQNLRPKVLEQVRLLTNLETTKHKLLQIFLVGQPELRTLLARPGLRQLNQRITARFHLTPLSPVETAAYIRHRLMIAGVDRPLFTLAAIKRIHKASAGVPRLTNVLCDRALLGACVRRAALVTTSIVDQAVREVKGEGEAVVRPRPRPVFTWSLMLSLLALALFTGWNAREWAERSAGVPLSDQIAALFSTAKPLTEAAGTGQGDLALPNETAPGPPSSTRLEDADGATVPEDAAASRATVDADGTEGLAGPTATAQADGENPGPAGQQQPDRPADETDEGDGIEVAADTPEMTTSEQAGLPADPNPVDRIRMQLTDADLDRLTMDRTTALRILLRRWGVELGEVRGGDPCAKIATFGLLCEQEHGNWANLRYFDRPVVIRVAAGAGYAVVGALGAKAATFDLEQGSEPIAISAFDDYWTGDYILLWQPPPIAGVTMVGPRSSRTAISWLHKLISRVPGSRLTDRGSSTYSSDLRQAVTRFQVDKGLSADGIAGPRTLIQLHNAVAMPGIPKLSN